MISRLRRRTDLVPAIATFGLVLLVAAVVTPTFYRLTNLQNLSYQFAFLAVVSLGQLIVIIAGGIDLSVGAVMSAALIVLVHVAGKPGGVVVAGLLAVVGATLAIGVINAALVTIRKVPAILATLGTLVLLNGVVLWITEGRSRGRVPDAIIPLGAKKALGIPIPLIVALIVAGLVWFALQRTVYGRSLFAAGSNSAAAGLSGVPVRSVVGVAFVGCSLLAMLAGLMLAGFIGFPDRTIGNGYDLSSIAVVVLGGAVLGGGRGTVLGTMIAAASLAALENVLVLLGIDVSLQLMAKAAVLLAAVSAPKIVGLRGSFEGWRHRRRRPGRGESDGPARPVGRELSTP